MLCVYPQKGTENGCYLWAFGKVKYCENKLGKEEKSTELNPDKFEKKGE